MPKAKSRNQRVASLPGLGLPTRREEEVLDSCVRTDSVLFDFSLDGGAVSTVSLGRRLPAGAIVLRILSDELTALTSGGAATVQLKAGSTALTGLIAFDTGFAGIDDQALVSSAEGIKISSASELTVGIATAALTAGKVRFFVEFLVPNDLSKGA